MNLTNQKKETEECTCLSHVKPHNYLLSAYYVHKIEGKIWSRLIVATVIMNALFWKGGSRDGIHHGMESEQ